MFSTTPTAPPAAALQSALAQQRALAVRLNRQAYVQIQSRASPVRPRPAVELVELAPTEPDRRERFWGEFLKSNIYRDRVDVVRSLVRNRPYLLQFEDVHRGFAGSTVGRIPPANVLTRAYASAPIALQAPVAYPR